MSEKRAIEAAKDKGVFVWPHKEQHKGYFQTPHKYPFTNNQNYQLTSPYTEILKSSNNPILSDREIISPEVKSQKLQTKKLIDLREFTQLSDKEKRDKYSLFASKSLEGSEKQPSKESSSQSDTPPLAQSAPEIVTSVELIDHQTVQDQMEELFRLDGITEGQIGVPLIQGPMGIDLSSSHNSLESTSEQNGAVNYIYMITRYLQHHETYYVLCALSTSLYHQRHIMVSFVLTFLCFLMLLDLQS
ncbi:MAG: hypothetical protein EZS28_039503, partial [Streblomastix strix]